MPSYFIYTFGCQMNVHDSRWIEQVLREKGYACSDCAERADLIIFNTCSVRAKAEQKLFSEVGTFRELKRARPELVIAIAGCMAQQHGRTLLLRQPIVDVVLGPDQISALPDLVDEARSSHRPLIAIERELEKPRFLRAKLPFHSPAATSFVTIMKGCDERCSFCIVPYTRGAERYRPADEIIDEIARLVARGVREVTLLGQTVNAWREPDSGHARRDPGFSALLRRVASDVPELIRLRYTSPHPRHVSAPLVQAHGELSVLPDHLHLPVQSGSDRVLKRMMRRHTREQYLESAFALKRARPGLALSTDLIVGFPGETDRDFTQTLSLVREVGFVSAYAFKYSPRPMTPALKLGDEIPEAVKEERLAELLALVESQQMAHLESLVGQRVQVLVEGPNGKDPSHVTGRSQRHEIVHVAVPPGSDLTGQLIDVVVQHANKHSLMASLTSLSFRALSDANKRAKKKRLRKALTGHGQGQDGTTANKSITPKAAPAVSEQPPPGIATGAAIAGRPIALSVWVSAVVAISFFYLVLKMFALNAYAGDEHIYLYQAKLVSEGIAPYSGFPMAHPPLQTLFTALIFKLFGYHFIIGRLLPIFWCLLGGLALAVLVLRELGAVASVSACALYLLSYEPLRASSHYTGVNMTIALLIGGVLAFRAGAIGVAAALCAAATFTRLYAIPGVVVLTIYALLINPRQGLRLIGWGAEIGGGLFIAVGLWSGFGNVLDHILLYHAQKTPMGEATLAVMRDTVVFHNAPIAWLFILAQVALIFSADQAFQITDKRAGLLERLQELVGSRGIGLLILCSSMTVVFLAILLSMDRVWMYYFIPAFPFAAVPAGWLVARWIGGAAEMVRARMDRRSGEISAADLSGGLLLLGLLIAGILLSPLLERNLGYYQRAIKKAPESRTYTYPWKRGKLPDVLNAFVRGALWKDQRVIGERYWSFNYLLWHESRDFDLLHEMVETVSAASSPDGEIFGDSGVVPLLALESHRRIAANEVDTNIQRYRSSADERRALIEKIDNPKTELIILRERFGVAGVQELQQLVREKYSPLKSFRNAEEGAVYQIFKRTASPRSTRVPSSTKAS